MRFLVTFVFGLMVSTEGIAVNNRRYLKINLSNLFSNCLQLGLCLYSNDEDTSD